MAIKIALLGCGSVGKEVAKSLLNEKYKISSSGADYEFLGIGVRNPRKDYGLDNADFTDNLYTLIDRADIVVELIGGVDAAKEYIYYALKNGKDVVTANKALIAKYKNELFALAKENNAEIWYEASCAAAIPIIRTMQDSLAADSVLGITGIINGSTNYILDSIDLNGTSYEEALLKAQDLGYAEADPKADVSGDDACQKLSILASIAFGSDIKTKDIYCKGIDNLSDELFYEARKKGYIIKLLAKAFFDNDCKGIYAYIMPCLISKSHALASVHKNQNAICLNMLKAGDIMFFGAGAGGVETSSAVLGDIVLSLRRIAGKSPAEHIAFKKKIQILPISSLKSNWHIILKADDKKGILADILSVLADNDISVKTIEQQPGSNKSKIIILTHLTQYQNILNAVNKLNTVEIVSYIASLDI